MNAPTHSCPPDTAVVVIGRNEGQRLITCLKSCSPDRNLVVYVDSASTDGSVMAARQLGCAVVELDMSTPFSAARARNSGLQAALRLQHDLAFVQFVDGDCELTEAWMPTARRHLEAHAEVAAVCGRLKERHPDHSIYNLMCDIEWNSPCGEVRSVGGIAMFRISALQAVNGFREDVVAGEEPELCVRLRGRGGRIHKLDAPMAFHDAAILRFKAWWTRTKRGGYAYALGQHLHGHPPEAHWRTEYKRALLWGLWLPLVILVLAAAHPGALALAWVYPAQWIRLSLRNLKDGMPHPFLRAGYSVLGKLAEAQGAVKWHIEHQRGLTARIIEYK